MSQTITELRLARPDDPAARALLAGLADEHARVYGEKTDGELSVREAEDFVPPSGVSVSRTVSPAPQN